MRRANDFVRASDHDAAVQVLLENMTGDLTNSPDLYSFWGEYTIDKRVEITRTRHVLPSKIPTGSDQEKWIHTPIGPNSRENLLRI